MVEVYEMSEHEEAPKPTTFRVADHEEDHRAEHEEARLPTGVWRRGPTDWAFRIEGTLGSHYGCGFSSREEAREAMALAKSEHEEARRPKGGTFLLTRKQLIDRLAKAEQERDEWWKATLRANEDRDKAEQQLERCEAENDRLLEVHGILRRRAETAEQKRDETQKAWAKSKEWQIKEATRRHEAERERESAKDFAYEMGKREGYAEGKAQAEHELESLREALPAAVVEACGGYPLTESWREQIAKRTLQFLDEALSADTQRDCTCTRDGEGFQEARDCLIHAADTQREAE